MSRLNRPAVWTALILAVSLLVFFWDVLFGDRVLLPLDNIWSFVPWSDYAAQVGAQVPHNHLISDAVLQNPLWKQLARDAISQGALPLWNPYILSGMPFMATGQASVLYPPGILFYVLPLYKAYGWFIALHLFLGGMFAYTYLRTIRIGWFGATFAALAFAYAGFLTVSYLWPMVVSCAVWLPLILALIELIVREFETTPRRTGRVVVWVIIGVLAVGLQFLAGHTEYSFYILFTSLFYAVSRFIVMLWQQRSIRPVIGSGIVLLGMMLVGIGLAAVQLIPFAEVISANFRSAFVSYEDVIGWALPKSQVLNFIMPDFFGNPSQHSFFDFFSRQVQSVAHVVDGRTIQYVPDWGPKNYVEGTSYLGILPLVLAVVALIFRRNRYTWIFLALGVWSLLLAFGTPLYRIVFSLPGLDQLHSPFRWIYPYSLSVVVLAGIGADWLATRFGQLRSRGYDIVAGLVFAAGIVSVIAVAFGALMPERFLSLAERVYQGSDRIQGAFASAAAFFSFELGNALGLAVFLVGSGLILWTARGRWRLPVRLGHTPLWMPLALIILVGDLWLFGWDFNARSNPQTVAFVPPPIATVKQDTDLYRVTSYGYDDVLPPDTAMMFGLQDIRGYDTVIPKQYLEYWQLIEPPQGLLYSKLDKLVEPASLSSPFLDLLGVKYVLTKTNIGLPNYTEVYRGEINVYRNDDALPRAFVVPSATLVDTKEQALDALRAPGFDPRGRVILERTPESLGASVDSSSAVSPLPANAARIVTYTPNEVHITVDTPQPGHLVLTDSYFPGWQATLNGQTAPLFKADYNFRAVAVPAGQSEVVFRFSPFSLKLGAFVSGISLLIVVLGVIYLIGRRLRPGLEEAGAVGRVAKNSLAPMAFSFLNKGIDIAFAMLMLRLLSPADVGKYYFAVAVIMYFEIFTNFGLNTFLTREVAKDPTSGNRYLGTTAILRLLLLVASVPVMLAFVVAYRSFAGLEADTTMVIALLAVSLVPGNISAALSSLFYAYEKMEYPAIITVVSTLLKVVIGTTLLILGYGIIGLAGTSVVVNIITVAIFGYLVVTRLFRPRLEFDRSSSRGILSTSFPLMLNHFLATVFFRADVLVLEPMHGSRAVGYYSTAYKFIDGLNIIPSTFTFAIFPILSRYADSAHNSLLRAYTMSLRMLIGISVPIVVGTVVLAEPIILFFGGDQYVPFSVVALQVLIWFLPFSYINSVTQYVLIAANQQRFLTYGFIIGASFNIVANLILISRFSYIGAAVVTILSEIVLLIPFMYCVRRHIGTVNLAALLLKPGIAAAIMGLVTWQLRFLNPLLVIVIGVIIYLTMMLLLKGITEEDRRVLRQLRTRGQEG